MRPAGDARPDNQTADTAQLRSGGSGKRFALAGLLVAMILGSIAYLVTHKDEVMQLAGIAKPAKKVPVVKAEPTETAALQKPDTAEPAPATAPPPQSASQPSAPAQPNPVVTTTITPTAADPGTPNAETASRIDAQFQQSRLWSYMKQSYPEWYGEQVVEVAKLADANKPESEQTEHMVRELVALRRKNADLALRAETGKLKGIANAFLENLQALSEKGADACYGFISQGEASRTTLALFNAPQESPKLEAQAISIFEAIAAGKASPAQHERPKKEDYDVLAAQLGKLGWSQADLQLFADPKALAKAEPARVCQMVRDWFKAHITISDAAVQERLLFETLRPVVAG